MAQAKFNKKGGVTLKLELKEFDFLARLIGNHVVGTGHWETVNTIYRSFDDILAVRDSGGPLKVEGEDRLYLLPDDQKIRGLSADLVIVDDIKEDTEEAPEFAVGDLVRVIEGNEPYIFTGNVGQVSVVDANDNSIKVEFKGFGNEQFFETTGGRSDWWIRPSDIRTLKPVQRDPVVGDVVRLIDDSAGEITHLGDIGRVTKVNVPVTDNGPLVTLKTDTGGESRTYGVFRYRLEVLA